jgi:hypothetical protein
MVTTFLTTEDYHQSAQTLDDLRLKKQCVEAYQLLNVLDDLHLVANKLHLPTCPAVNTQNLIQQEQWVKLVWNEYKRINYYYYFCDRKLMKCDRSTEFFTIDKTYVLDKHFFINKRFDGEDGEDEVTVLISPADYRKCFDPNYRGRSRVERTFLRGDILIKDHGDRLIKLGYANHPAARMWLTYEESLIAYLNAHLDEYYRRNGKDMNIPRYRVKDEVRPWWIKRDLLLSHQASLIRKQRSYYENIFTIPDIYHTLGYIWPSMFSAELANDLVNEKFNSDLFSPIGGTK